MTAQRPSRASLPPAFRRLWLAAGGSNLGDGIVKIALPLLAVRMTDSPALVSGVTLALTLPWLAVALFAGAVIDRSDRRRVMVTANAIRVAGAVVLVLAVATRTEGIVLLYAIALLMGVGEVFHDSAAPTILPQVVADRDLERANGRLYSTELVMNQFVGPPLGGALLGLAAAFAIAGSAAGFAVSVLALLTIRGNYAAIKPARELGSLFGDVKQGLTYLAGHRLLFGIALLGAVANGAWAAWEAVFVLFARSAGGLDLSEAEYGILRGVTATGAVLGAAVASRVNASLGPLHTLILTLVGWTLFLGSPWLSSNPFVVGFFIFVGSITGAIFSILIVTLRQRTSPPDLLGRVNATFRSLTWGALPVGALVGGLVGELAGVRAVFALSAGLTLLLVVPVRLALWDGVLRH